MTKGVKKLALILWWLLEDDGSDTSPAPNRKGTPDHPTPPFFCFVLFCLGLCFSWGVASKKIYGRQARTQRRRCEDHQLSGVYFGRKLFRDTCFLSKKNGFVLGWACRKLPGLRRWVASWVGRRHSNDSIETFASMPSDFVEAAVRGRIGDMESLVSTPLYFVEAALRGSIGDLE